MYFEFAGIPGSGKTTLSSALVNCLKKKDRNVHARHDAVIRAIRKRDDGFLGNMLKHLPSRLWQFQLGPGKALPEFVTHSSRFMELVGFVSQTLDASELPPLLKESIWNTFARTFAERHLISTHMAPRELVVMDEAFCQRCFTLFGYMETDVPDRDIIKFSQLAPFSDTIIYVSADPETCVCRFMERYRFQPVPYDFKLDHKELLMSFQNGTRILHCLASELEQMGKRVFYLKGDNDLRDEIEKVNQIAASLFV